MISKTIITETPNHTITEKIRGPAAALARFASYNSRVYWKQHGIYFKQQIDRAYWMKNSRPCALYRAMIGDVTLYDDNLAGIKDEIKRYLGATE